MTASTPDPQDLGNEDASLSRRSVVRAAAWSIPVITAAVAAPLAAASVAQPPQTDTFTTITSGPIGTTAPTWAKFVDFILVGGVGGTEANRVNTGGDIVTGTLAVTAGQAFSVRVGEGGTVTSNAPSQSAAGGRGHGTGGAVGTVATTAGWTGVFVTGGSGGGGSALYVNGSPVAIAAGSGGASGFNAMTPSPGVVQFATINGATGIRSSSNANIWVTAQTGLNAIGTTPGGSVSQRAAAPGALGVGGGNGNAGFTSAGGQGIGISLYGDGTTTQQRWVASGGGGGGRACGGSGAVECAKWGSANSNGMYVFGGAGGRGSSFTAASVLGPTTGVYNNTLAGGAGVRRNGTVTLTWRAS